MTPFGAKRSFSAYRQEILREASMSHLRCALNTRPGSSTTLSRKSEPPLQSREPGKSGSGGDKFRAIFKFSMSSKRRGQEVSRIFRRGSSPGRGGSYHRPHRHRHARYGGSLRSDGDRRGRSQLGKRTSRPLARRAIGRGASRCSIRTIISSSGGMNLLP